MWLTIQKTQRSPRSWLLSATLISVVPAGQQGSGLIVALHYFPARDNVHPPHVTTFIPYSKHLVFSAAIPRTKPTMTSTPSECARPPPAPPPPSAPHMTVACPPFLLKTSIHTWSAIRRPPAACAPPPPLPPYMTSTPPEPYTRSMAGLEGINTTAWRWRATGSVEFASGRT